MKNKKYIVIVFAIIAIGVGLVFLAPHVTFADKYGLSKTGAVAGINTKSSSLSSIVGEVIKGALGLTGIIFLVLLIYAGYIWMIARGNTEKVEKSLNTMKAAVIGIVIVALAYAITNYVVFQVLSNQGTPTGGSGSCNPACTGTDYCGTDGQCHAVPPTQL